MTDAHGTASSSASSGASANSSSTSTLIFTPLDGNSPPGKLTDSTPASSSSSSSGSSSSRLGSMSQAASLPCSFDCVSGILTFGQLPQLIQAVYSAPDALMTARLNQKEVRLSGGTILQHRYSYKSRAAKGRWNVERVFFDDEAQKKWRGGAENSQAVAATVFYHESITAATVFNRASLVQISLMNDHEDRNIFYINRYDWSWAFRWPDAARLALLTDADIGAAHADAVNYVADLERQQKEGKQIPNYLPKTVTDKEYLNIDGTLDKKFGVFKARQMFVVDFQIEALKNWFTNLKENYSQFKSGQLTLLPDHYETKKQQTKEDKKEETGGVQFRTNCHLLSINLPNPGPAPPSSSSDLPSASSASCSSFPPFPANIDTSSTVTVTVPIGVHVSFPGEYELGWLLFGDDGVTLLGFIWDCSYCELELEQGPFSIESECVLSREQMLTKKAEREFRWKQAKQKKMQEDADNLRNIFANRADKTMQQLAIEADAKNIKYIVDHDEMNAMLLGAGHEEESGADSLVITESDLFSLEQAILNYQASKPPPW